MVQTVPQITREAEHTNLFGFLLVGYNKKEGWNYDVQICTVINDVRLKSKKRNEMLQLCSAR